MARPRKKVDEERLRSLALIGCTNIKIAQALGISHDTLQRRYLPLIEQVRSDGETRILAKTFQKAMSGSMRALELSLINRCGWATQPQVAISVVQNAGTPGQPNPAEFRQRYAEAQRFLEQHQAELKNNGSGQPHRRSLPGI